MCAGWCRGLLWGSGRGSFRMRFVVSVREDCRRAGNRQSLEAQTPIVDPHFFNGRALGMVRVNFQRGVSMPVLYPYSVMLSRIHVAKRLKLSQLLLSP